MIYQGDDFDLDKRLLANSTEMLILKLLEEENLYRYQITEKLWAQFWNVFEWKAGTLIPPSAVGAGVLCGGV